MAVPEFDKLLNQLPQQVRDYIFISNGIEDKDLLEFYRAAALFVYPSKAEGFGIPPLEAAAAKIPVICSNSSAMSDFLFFGENHIDPADFDGFKKRLLELTDRSLNNEEQLDNLSRIIQQKYSWSQAADSLRQLILNDKYYL
jgi:glycosyltransferase involved in cell wall biosynthesis